MARILDLDELPHEPHSHEFVGADHGDVPFSIILVHSRPGVGPKLHRHPYAEVFLVEAGRATFQIGEERLVVPAGHVVVSPPGEAHGFVNGGRGELRLITIQHGMARRAGSGLVVEAEGLGQPAARSQGCEAGPRHGRTRRCQRPPARVTVLRTYR